MTRKKFDRIIDAALAQISQREDIDPRVEAKGGNREGAITLLATGFKKNWEAVVGQPYPAGTPQEATREIERLADFLNGVTDDES